MSTRLRASESFKKNRYLELIEQHFDVRGRTGSEIMAMCPWHDNTRSPALQINMETGNFVCFQPDCGARGGPKSLKRHCGVPVDDADEGLDVNAIYSRLDALNNQAGVATQLPPIAEETLNRYAFPTPYWGPHNEDCSSRCKKHRELSPTIIEAFDLGSDPMNDVGTIPIRNRRGQLLGVIRRDLTGEELIKYKYPKNFKKSHELFASWLADHAHTSELVLVEGSIDCMKVWQAGFCCMAQYGSAISPEQIRMIRSMGFTKIVLFYDNDKAGRTATQIAQGRTVHTRGKQRIESYEPALDLTRDFLVHSVVYEDGWKNDPGENDSITIATAIINAPRIT